MGLWLRLALPVPPGNATGHRGARLSLRVPLHDYRMILVLRGEVAVAVEVVERARAVAQALLPQVPRHADFSWCVFS
jgi:hypothetical protein